MNPQGRSDVSGCERGGGKSRQWVILGVEKDYKKTKIFSPKMEDPRVNLIDIVSEGGETSISGVRKV